MENKEYLNEETFQKNKRKVTKVSMIILLIGILIGGSLIATGIVKNNDINSKYSIDSQVEIEKQLQAEKEKLENIAKELTERGVRYSAFTKHTDGDEYKLKIITSVLDPSFSYYEFDEYKNNEITSKYCELKEKQDSLKNGFYKEHEQSKNIGFFMFGGFIIFASCIISGSIYMTTKQREIVAFQAQQIIPVAQEGIEKMAPTIAKIGKEMSDEMASSYGKIAKEVAKGFKEGMKDDK